MTTKAFLNSRAKTIYETWGKDLPNDILFFTSSNQISDIDLPLISLPNVDDTYPPQKKSFFMLKFMNDFFSDHYKFFMRSDDDVFINVEHLNGFLRKLNSSDLIYIGQTGVGNKDEFGQLNLNLHDNFCMGGPGVIFSSQSLRKISTNIKYCLKNLLSTHEDVEIGRCLHKFASISCTWSYDMQNLFYHNSTIQDLILASSDNNNNHLNSIKNLMQIITIHPIKNSEAMKKLYYYFQSLNKKELNFKLTKVLRTVNHYQLKELYGKKFSTIIRNNFTFNDNIVKPTFKKLSRHSNANIWKFFQQKLFIDKSMNPMKNLDKDIVDSFNLNMNYIMNNLNNLNSNKKGIMYDYHSLHYGYLRKLPSIGVQYILNFLIIYRKYHGKRLTIPIKKHIHAIQTFANERFSHIRNDNNDLEKIINIIVPLAERIRIFERFIDNCIKVYENDDKHITLTVILFPMNSNETTSKIEKILNKFNGKKQLIIIDGKFSRGIALQKSSKSFKNDSLLFFLDVDIAFNSHVLKRVRKNTIKNKQIYYPIVFSQYDGRLTRNLKSNFNKNFNDDNNNGYWRQFGFGILSCYNEDLIQNGGFDTNIAGWGIEDVNLYDRFIANNNLQIFRSIDPDLIHIYHRINCDQSLSPKQYEMCLGTKFFTLDSIEAISSFINDYHLLLD